VSDSLHVTLDANGTCSFSAGDWSLHSDDVPDGAKQALAEIARASIWNEIDGDEALRCIEALSQPYDVTWRPA
jgi:hypothetical protein